MPEEGGRNQAAPATRPSFLVRHRRRLIVAVLLLLVAGGGVAATLFLPSLGLRWGVPEMLRRAGMISVSLGEGDLSLFRGQVVIRQMAAQPKEGQPLHVEDLILNFRWRPLLDRLLSLPAVDLKGVSIAVEKRGDGYVVNGLPLGGGGSGAKPWGVDLDALKLADSRITYVDGTFKVGIEVESLSLDALRSREPDKPTTLHLKGRINGAPIMLDGTVTPFAGQPAYALQLKLDGLDLAGLGPLAGRLGIARPVGRLSADLAIDGLAAASATTTLDGRLGLAGLSAEIDDTRLAGGLQWNGKIVIGAQTELKGRLTADKFSTGRGGLNFEAGNLQADLTHGSYDSANGRMAATGSLAGGLLSLNVGGARMSADSLQAAVEALEFVGGKSRLAWKGSAKFGKFVIAGQDVEFTRGAMSWSGTTELGLADPEHVTGRLAGQVESDDAHIRIGDITVDERHSSVGLTLDLLANGTPALGLLPMSGPLTVKADGAAIGRAGQPLITAEHAETDRLAVDAQGRFSIGTLALSGATIRLVRTRQGFAGLSGQNDSGGGGLVPVTIGRLALGKQSQFLFEDQTTREPFKLRLSPLEATLAEIDTGNPEHDSQLTLNGRVGQATLGVTGAIRPLGGLQGDLKIRIRALELPPLSPYAAEALGIRLRTGHFDGDIGLSVVQRKLSGKAEMTLSNLYVDQPDPNAPLAKKTDMPVETVLDLLRDGQNRIHLTIPVSGDLDKPDFDISDAVNQAIGGALAATASTTLKVLFPVAMLVSIVTDDDHNQRVALEPLKYGPGQDSLSDEDRKKLSKVADLMHQRPSLKLSLCGVATVPGDWPALAEQQRKASQGMVGKLQDALGLAGERKLPPPDFGALGALAEHRSGQAKAYLTERSDIDPGRLYDCRGRVENESDKKGDGRVELLL